MQSLMLYIASHMWINNFVLFFVGLVSRHKWLEGGVFFKEEIPKSENGKILRRVLKHEALKQLKSKM